MRLILLIFILGFTGCKDQSLKVISDTTITNFARYRFDVSGGQDTNTKQWVWVKSDLVNLSVQTIRTVIIGVDGEPLYKFVGAERINHNDKRLKINEPYRWWSGVIVEPCQMN